MKKKVLIVAATRAEIAPTLAQLNIPTSNNTVAGSFESTLLDYDFLIGGVGIPSTVYCLTKALLKKSYDSVINVGIAGSFNPSLKIGTCVEVVSERFADLGADDQGAFLDVFDLGLTHKDEPPYNNGQIVLNSLQKSLKSTSGITVNKTSGNTQMISSLVQKYNPEIESMEGAAVAFVAQQENCRCSQVRCISNYVTPRNKNEWNIPLAIRNLNNWLVQHITTPSHKHV